MIVIVNIFAVNIVSTSWFWNRMCLIQEYHDGCH